MLSKHVDKYIENWQRELDTWTEKVFTHVDTQYSAKAKHWIENQTAKSWWRNYDVPWQLRGCLEQGGKRFEWSEYSDENGLRWDNSGWVEIDMETGVIRTNNHTVAFLSCHNAANPLVRWNGTITVSEEPIAIGPANRPVCAPLA